MSIMGGLVKGCQRLDLRGNDLSSFAKYSSVNHPVAEGTELFLENSLTCDSSD
jgi:hypothetical protein